MEPGGAGQRSPSIGDVLPVDVEEPEDDVVVEDDLDVVVIRVLVVVVLERDEVVDLDEVRDVVCPPGLGDCTPPDEVLLRVTVV